MIAVQWDGKHKGGLVKTKVADMGSLVENKGHCVKANGVSLVVIKSEGTVHAVENKCPHVGLPLGKGKIEGGEIVCPFHGSRFNIAPARTPIGSRRWRA